MSSVNAIEIFFAIVLIGLFIGVLVNRYTAVSLQQSNIDSRRYIVRNLHDKQKAADMLGSINNDLVKICREMKKRYPQDEDVKRLLKNFNPENVSESSASDAYTSYSINKGERVVLCIRSKKNHVIQEKNLLMYVAIHELAHIMTRDVGHTNSFWENNKRLLNVAVDIGVYTKDDYATNPTEYCGISLTNSII